MRTFSPDFMESPPPSLPEATEATLPAFSGEEDIDLYYAVRKDPDIKSLLAKPLDWDLFAEEPTVLILHTHTTESYTRQGEDYKETSAWRTLDPDYNMLAIGSLVAEILEDAGIRVIRAEDLHDYPSYSGSYIRSRQSIRDILKEHPGIQLVLDLHRDAAGEGGKQLRTLAKVDGEDSAQLMVVIGTNHDAYEENLSLGLKLHVQLEQQNPGIMRPLQLRTQRFNQVLNPGALLIEVGAAGNNHKEARIAATQLAKAIVTLAKGTA
jgi:stage II sporulation protein P